MRSQTIGISHKRIEGRHKLSGTARYAADHSFPGMLYAYGVFSTVAHARVVAIDDREAASMPGVVGVFHHRNFLDIHQAPKIPVDLGAVLSWRIMEEHRLPFEDDRIYYAGQFVAIVVADTFEHARAAAHRVQITYDEHEPIKSLAEGLARHGFKNGGGHTRGNADVAFADASHKIEAIYTTPVEAHNPMEMHATTAYWDGGKLIVYEASQAVVNHRNVLADVFDLTPECVEVRAPFIGSGFGGKLWAWPHSIATCAVARLVGRPVQLVVPRAQMFTTVGHRPETVQTLRLATDDNGRLCAISHESVNATSVIEDYTETCGDMTKSLYSCPNVTTRNNHSAVHRGTPTSMRAPGAAPGLFALESSIDEMAIAIGMDPLTFRQLNVAAKDESTGLPWSSNHLQEAMAQAADRFGWHRRNPVVGAMREGDTIIGYGMAACNWEAFRVASDARVTLRADGSALAQCGLQDIGTGTYTIFAQTVAQLTGLPFERIEVELGSSAFPPGPVSGGSWATASGMEALAGATRAALRQLMQFAVAKGAPFAGAKPEDLNVEGGTLKLGDRSAAFSAVLESQRLARAEGRYHSDGVDMTRYSFRSFGAHFVEVRWDPGISRLRVSRVVSAIDVGKIINPVAARNQVEGGIVMGIGMALFEAADYDARNGMPVNNNYAEYVVPVHADQPDIDVIFLDYPDYHLGEFGARGVGEIGVTGIAAAVANAVYHATGKRVRSLPITLEKLMDGAATATS
jgi:xanthine dehydrogenase YagR molybdenum-binding subunit